MRCAGLFSGIGGFSLAAQWMGWQNIFEVEKDEWCRKVLHKNFPNSQLFEDVCTFDGRPFCGLIDILCGGFPCQPFSDAGKGLGTADPRHLWPQFLRIIREIRPRVVVGENVRGLLSWNGGLQFEAVCADLEAEGYTVLPLLLPACGVGAPHKRDRFWFVAYAHSLNADGTGLRASGLQLQESPALCERIATNATGRGVRCGGAQGQARQPAQLGEATPDTSCGRLAAQQSDLCRWQSDTSGRSFADAHGVWQPQCKGCQRQFWRRAEYGSEGTVPSFRLTEPPLCGPNDGLPARLVRTASPRAKQLKAYGNAIVPQVAYQIFQAIQQTT
jgi:DNA (cytosine-5)-methyltransferase 1